MPVPDPIAQGRENWIDHENGRVDQITAASTLIRASQLVQGISAQIVSPKRVTGPQLEMLFTLDRLEIPASIGGLAEELRLHPTTVARTVTRLARRGYARRTQDPGDARVAAITITAVGREIVIESLRDLAAADFGIVGWDVDDARRFTELVAPILTRSASTPTPPPTTPSPTEALDG
jgi:DNA-binding MarR family transcriptional regulator